MLHDIEPKKYNNSYIKKKVTENSIVMMFHHGKILCKNKDGIYTFTKYADLNKEICNIHYAFAIDDQDYFISDNLSIYNLEGFEFIKISELRNYFEQDEVFAAVNCSQLFRWYRNNKYCGRCAAEMQESSEERALVCPECGNIIYPRINPAIIVAVLDSDRVVLTKYAGREYKKHALIAGFTEIGESIEQTVEREVMEEVGLEVENISFYKSQPWPYSDSLLLGFIADVKGSRNIKIDVNELSEAEWVKFDDIPNDFIEAKFSLTKEIMQNLKDHKIQR